MWMMPWLLIPEEAPEDRRNTLKQVHMQPFPEYHHAFARRFGIDVVSVGYGQTEAGAGFVGWIDEFGDEEGTPPELLKGYTREDAWRIAGELGVPILRGDSKIKKGENISSYQIEDIITGHPQVGVCAAFPIPAAEGEEDDIVVYVVSQGELSEEDLRTWMGDQIPKFMRPQHIRFVDALPQTPTYKIEKYKLKRQFLEESGNATTTERFAQTSAIYGTRSPVL
jgi:hypothetical protein